jgi:hypothetical protein
MTDIPKLTKAKAYIESLVKGSDLGTADLTDCLRYAADILGQVIANGGIIKLERQAEKAEFFITPEQIACIPVSESPITLLEFADRVNAQIDLSAMKKLPVGAMTSWLDLSCVLTSAVDADGSKRKVPTVRGNRIGVSSELRQGPRGEYTAVLYDENAQRFLIQNLADMLCRHNERAKEFEEYKESV